MSQSIPTPLTPSNNLSDLASAATARSNLGLGTAATHAATDFDAAGAAADAQSAAVSTAEAASCQRVSNLSDVASASTARTNLGLGTAATMAAGSADGVATLDGSGHLTTSQIPAALVGAVVYQGTWRADINSPTLTSGGGGSSSKGFYYVVSVAGATSFDGISVWNPGDAVISDGSAWEKIDGVASEVLSFNGRTGAVTPQSGDYTPSQVGLGNVANNLQLVAGNNLSDLSSVSTAWTNLGLASAAGHASSDFDAAGSAASAQAAAIASAELASCQRASNLSDVASATTAATNLGLGTANSPTFAGLTVSGVTTAEHFVGGGATPTVAAGSGLGGMTGPTISITGTDASMNVTATTTSSGSAGVLFTVTFATPFATAPFPVFSAASSATAGDLTNTHSIYVTATTTTLTLTSGAGTFNSGITVNFNIKT